MKRIIVATFVAALLAGATSQPVAVSQVRDLEAEARRKADKDRAEKRYQELKEAVAELHRLSETLTEQVEQSNQHVISAKILETTEKIEKLVKRIRDRARGY